MKKEYKTKLLLQPKDFKSSFKDWEVKGVLNPAAVRMPNKKILMYARVAEQFVGHKGKKQMTCPLMVSQKEYKASYQKIKTRDIIRVGRWGEMYLKDGTCRLPTISHFKQVLISEDGFTIESIQDRPAFSGIPNESEYGIEDPRITKIGNKYYMTYVGVSINEGVSTYLAVSKNLEKWKRLGLIFRIQNKDVVLFPEKIKNKYVALHRPEGFFEFSKPNIWISYSPDLVYWGKEKSILQTRENAWDNVRIGSGCPPIKIKKGWLAIYHGVKEKIIGDKTERVYNGGAVILDYKNPEKVIARSGPKNPLIIPNNKYEQLGFINNVVFPTAAIPTLDGKNLLIYSGGADSIVSVREISLKDIFRNLKI